MGFKNALDRTRDDWEKINRKVIKDSGLKSTKLDKATALIEGYIFNYRTGHWHKKGNGKKIYGQSARFFLKFLKDLPSEDNK